MKLLYIAVHRHKGWGAEYWLAQSFRRLGVEVTTFDYRRWRRRRAPWWLISKRLESLVRQHRPDVVFLQRAERMPAWVMDLPTQAPVVFWSTEPLARNDDVAGLLRGNNLDWLFVHTYTCFRLIESRYPQHALHASVLHNACPSETIRAPASPVRFGVFNRSVSERRKEWLRHVGDLVEVVQGNYGDRYFDDLRASQVSVNIHYGEASIDDFESGIFEGMASGCAIVSERLNPRTVADLGMGDAIIEVSSPEEMKDELIRLQHDPSRLAHYRGMSRQVIQENTWDVRARQFLDKFEELIGLRKGSGPDMSS